MKENITKHDNANTIYLSLIFLFIYLFMFNVCILTHYRQSPMSNGMTYNFFKFYNGVKEIHIQ